PVPQAVVWSRDVAGARLRPRRSYIHGKPATAEGWAARTLLALARPSVSRITPEGVSIVAFPQRKHRQKLHPFPTLGPNRNHLLAKHSPRRKVVFSACCSSVLASPRPPACAFPA